MIRAQELCESQGGCPGLPVPNSPYGLCGRKAKLNLNFESLMPSQSCVWQVWKRRQENIAELKQIKKIVLILLIGMVKHCLVLVHECFTLVYINSFVC